MKIYKVGNPNVISPRILGHEFVGEIVELDKNIKEFKLGDRVTMATTISCGNCVLCLKGLGNMCNNKIALGTIVDGAFAEYMLIPALGIIMFLNYRKKYLMKKEHYRNHLAV